MKKEQFKKFILEKGAAMKTMSVCIVNMKKEISTMETEKEFLENSNTELLLSAKWKEATSICTKDNSIEIIPPMYLGFALRVKEGYVPFYCKDVSELEVFTSGLQRFWWRRDDKVQEFRMPQEGGTFSAPGNLFQLCSSHTRYIHFISCVEQGLQKIVKQEANEKQ